MESNWFVNRAMGRPMVAGCHVASLGHLAGDPGGRAEGWNAHDRHLGVALDWTKDLLASLDWTKATGTLDERSKIGVYSSPWLAANLTQLVCLRE